MSGPELHETFRKHGGVKQIHVMPVRDEHGRHVGWANTAVFRDGSRYTLTPQEEREYLNAFTAN